MEEEEVVVVVMPVVVPEAVDPNRGGHLLTMPVSRVNLKMPDCRMNPMSSKLDTLRPPQSAMAAAALLVPFLAVL